MTIVAASLGTEIMRIRQRTISYVLNLSILAILWVLGAYFFLENDGFRVVASSEAGRFERLLPFAMVGLLFLTGWMARILFSGGIYAVLDDIGVKLTGIFSDRHIVWDEVESVAYKSDEKGRVKLFDLSLRGGTKIRIYTNYSSANEDEFRTFLQACGVSHQSLTEKMGTWP
jgi:hypothetical protein